MLCINCLNSTNGTCFFHYQKKEQQESQHLVGVTFTSNFENKEEDKKVGYNKKEDGRVLFWMILGLSISALTFRYSGNLLVIPNMIWWGLTTYLFMKNIKYDNQTKI